MVDESSRESEPLKSSAPAGPAVRRAVLGSGAKRFEVVYYPDMGGTNGEPFRGAVGGRIVGVGKGYTVLYASDHVVSIRRLGDAEREGE